jgi:hypothetical protein
VRFPRSPWARAAIGAGVWSVLVAWVTSGGKKIAPPGAGAVVAERIELDPIPLVAGVQYAGAIVTHGGANLAGRSSVLSAAAKHGFVDVVAEDRPIAGWPWTQLDADWYVVARYKSDPRTQARHEGGFGGSGDVVEAFRAIVKT